MWSFLFFPQLEKPGKPNWVIAKPTPYLLYFNSRIQNEYSCRFNSILFFRGYPSRNWNICKEQYRRRNFFHLRRFLQTSEGIAKIPKQELVCFFFPRLQRSSPSNFFSSIDTSPTTRFIHGGLRIFPVPPGTPKVLPYCLISSGPVGGVLLGNHFTLQTLRLLILVKIA